MTEPATAAHPSATPLAALLLSTAAAHSSAEPRFASSEGDLAAYRGALSPRRLDAPEREMEALAFGAAVHDLGWLRRFGVRGEDRFRWLNGMVTNTVSGLTGNAGAWNLALNAQGRILGDLHVWREGTGQESDALELAIAADQCEKLLAHLDRFIVMDDVELIPLPELTAVGVSGPLAGDVLARLGFPPLPEPLTMARAAWNGKELRLVRGYGVLAAHCELWTAVEELPALWTALIGAGAVAVGTDALDALRIAEAIPAYGVDMVERDLPQETSQMRALHFTKGCYLGQEIVERIRSRGNVHRHLRSLELDGPLPLAGCALTFLNAAGAEMPAGEIGSAAELPLPGRVRRFALATIRGEAELRNRPLTYTAGEAQGTARMLDAPPSFEA
jgi:folate-binding protein YgfZ